MGSTPCGTRVAALIGLVPGSTGNQKAPGAKIPAGAETYVETQNYDHASVAQVRHGGGRPRPVYALRAGVTSPDAG